MTANYDITSGQNVSGNILNNGDAEYVESGGTANATLLNSGSQELVSSGGTDIGSTVNSGAYELIANGGYATNIVINRGTVEFSGSADSGESLSFTGSGGILTLDNTANFAGIISGFSVGDSLNLQDVSGVTSVTWANDTLNISYANGNVVQLALPGNFQTNSFLATPNAQGGTQISLIPPPSIAGVSYDAATGILTLTGDNLSTAATDYNLSDFTITGDGGNSYQLTNSSTISGTPSANSLAIQLSATDELAINGLLNADGTQANDAHTAYNLSTSLGWDINANAVTNQGITVTNVTPPSITAVSYNPATGEFTFIGHNIVNQGANNAIIFNDFTISGNGNSYTFNASDTISNVTANGFNITLSASDQTAVNAFVTNNADISGSHPNFILTTTGNWDSDTSTAIAAQILNVNATAVLTIISQGLGYASGLAVDTLGNLFIIDSNNNQILELAAGSTTLTTFDATIENSPTSIALDSTGNVYFVNDNGQTIDEIVTNSHTLITLANTGLNYARGLAVDSIGNIYAADIGNGSILELAAGSNSLTTLFNTPGINAIAVDSVGNLYYTNYNNAAITEISANGNTLTTIPTLNNGNLNSIAIDSAGNLFVTYQSYYYSAEVLEVTAGWMFVALLL